MTIKGALLSLRFLLHRSTLLSSINTAFPRSALLSSISTRFQASKFATCSCSETHQVLRFYNMLLAVFLFITMASASALPSRDLTGKGFSFVQPKFGLPNNTESDWMPDRSEPILLQIPLEHWRPFSRLRRCQWPPGQARLCGLCGVRQHWTLPSLLPQSDMSPLPFIPWPRPSTILLLRFYPFYLSQSSYTVR